MTPPLSNVTPPNQFFLGPNVPITTPKVPITPYRPREMEVALQPVGQQVPELGRRS